MSQSPTFPQLKFAANTLIFNKGDVATRLYIIASGQVEIFDPVSGRQIAMLSEGDAFGEQAILVGGIRGASAKATQDTVCMEITTMKLREMLQFEQGLLRPTIEALLLQLTMHNELQNARSLGRASFFEVSKRFTGGFINPMLDNETYAELPAEELQRIQREIEAEKHKIQLKPGETVAMVYDRLRTKKEAEARARLLAARPVIDKPKEELERKISREELTSFLASEEARTLPTKDALFLKLLDNKSLESTGFSPNQKILSVGDTPNTAFIITAGEATLSGTKSGLCTLGPGSVIGLAEGISDSIAEVNIIARTPVVAITIPVLRALTSIRAANAGLLGIARFTTMRILESETPPASLSR
jgi:CRP/FNR family cyclic AMP-dependent transcriptional regulator